MKEIIKQNNELMLGKLLSEKSSDMTKLEFMSTTILANLVSSHPEISNDELTERAIELTKALIKKINSYNI